MHFKLKTGDILIDSLFNDKISERLASQGFAYKVNIADKNDYIDFLKAKTKIKNVEKKTMGVNSEGGNIGRRTWYTFIRRDGYSSKTDGRDRRIPHNMAYYEDLFILWF
jgi:hypothetical protein